MSGDVHVQFSEGLRVKFPRTTQPYVRTDEGWLYLAVVMDLYSRMVVGWLIADCESQELARKLIQETALKQGVQPNQLTIHADNGPSMKSHTVAQRGVLSAIFPLV